MNGKGPVRVVVVGELLNSRRILHPATQKITIGRLAAIYEAVAKARSDLSRCISDGANGSLELLHAATLVRCALVMADDADASAIYTSLATLPEVVPCGDISLSCAIRTSRVAESSVIEEFCRLMTSLPGAYLSHQPQVPLSTVPDVDELADHGDWVGGQHAHAQIAASLASRGLHQLGDWQCVRIDGSGTLSSISIGSAIADLREAALNWTQWFANLGQHPTVLNSLASVVMSISDDAVLLVPAGAAASLESDLRKDFELRFPRSKLRWAAAHLTESSTPFSVAECYHSKLRAARREGSNLA